MAFWDEVQVWLAEKFLYCCIGLRLLQEFVAESCFYVGLMRIIFSRLCGLNQKLFEMVMATNFSQSSHVSVSVAGTTHIEHCGINHHTERGTRAREVLF